MAEGDNIYDVLRCRELDQAEFEQLLGSFYGHGHHVAPNEIRHGRAQRGCAIRALYDGDGKLIQLLVGPDVNENDIEQLRRKIEAELLTPGLPRVRRQVLFAAVPTIGHFQHKDLFQIAPVPPEAPRPRYIMGHHPFFLECRVQTSSNFMITSLRQQRIGRELELVLSSMLDIRVWSLGPELRNHWSIDVVDDAAVLPTKFLQEGYAWEGAVFESEDFSPTDSVPAIEFVEAQQYYSMRGISVDRKLDLLADFSQQLDRFFALGVSDREKFLRASYWFQHAGVVFSYSKSASFVALVSAIEALMLPPSAGEKCPECNRSTGPGPTRQFVDFVEALIPGSGISKRDRQRFYQIRSALTHGGKLLAVDHGTWGFTPKQLGEDYDARVMWKIVQYVLHNWLANK
jgi:hypothetical protein